jgi:uncharacterized DUF497 family protein
VVQYRYGGLHFAWDESKATSNKGKQGVSFEEAVTVFADPLGRIYDDPDHSVEEDRFLLVGHSLEGRVLLVVHAERRDRIRIISARKPTARERKEYKNNA